MTCSIGIKCEVFIPWGWIIHRKTFHKKLHYLESRPIFIPSNLEFLHYSNHQNHPIWFLVEVSIWYHRYSYGGQLVHHKRRRREPCGSCRLTPKVFFYTISLMETLFKLTLWVGSQNFIIITFKYWYLEMKWTKENPMQIVSLQNFNNESCT